MENNIPKHIPEIKKLSNENTQLQRETIAAKELIDALKSGSIDALVFSQEKALKVYTEVNADKPYRILIEKMHEGAVTLNEDGLILFCNYYFANLVNLPLQKVIGSVFGDYIDDFSKIHIETLLAQRSVDIIKEEVNILASEGKVIPALMSVNALWLDNIFVLGIILTDLTILNENQKKLKRRTKQLQLKNEELERANFELAFQIDEKEKRGVELSIANTEVLQLDALNTHKESVIVTLAHDLRSPLAGIIGASELLKENFETMESSSVKSMLELLYTASKEELNMLDYLVEWARIKYASEIYSPEKIELVHYVGKVFDTLNENAVANGINLYNEVEENIFVFADGKMLLSILQNILSNSIKYTCTGGKITITALKMDDKIIIEVKDTGIGMSNEVREKLFTPQMYSLSNARQEDKGAGIGLLLVKGFLEKNGGEIWVESKEGEGTSFYFTLFPEKPPVKEVPSDTK